jgi:protein-L-isoaspartate(D-aspartate) O-methyltransferase
MSVVPMELFCPTSQLSNVNKNQPIPIGYNETISQPTLTAYMLGVLQVDRGDKVLELKTASGYQTALLAQMGAEVTSLESDRALARVMAPTLNSLGFDNLHYIVGGDCYAGWPKNGPYDRIIATAAYAAPPPIALFNQLKPGGILIAPVGKEVGGQYLMAYTKTSSGEVKADKLMRVSFGPMPRRNPKPTGLF